MHFLEVSVSPKSDEFHTGVSELCSVSNDQLANCTVEAINAGLQSLKSSRSPLGKVAVIVDRNIEEAS
jgi:hypothetical protein